LSQLAARRRHRSTEAPKHRSTETPNPRPVVPRPVTSPGSQLAARGGPLIFGFSLLAVECWQLELGCSAPLPAWIGSWSGL